MELSVAAHVQSYIDQGYSKEEAEDKAWRELLEEIAFDSVSGFITGGVMGGASSAVNYISTGKTAQQIMAGADSSRLKDLQGFYVAQLAAGVQESDTAQEQKRKIAAWLRQGGEYTTEQLQQARSMAEDKINGREVVYPQAQKEAEPEYAGQRYEMAAEEIIDNAKAMATEASPKSCTPPWPTVPVSPLPRWSGRSAPERSPTNALIR